MADLLDWGESTRAQARTAVSFAAEGVVTCKLDGAAMPIVWRW